jgi:23S rRNA (uridine2552-2'-O)-methyltransferase
VIAVDPRSFDPIPGVTPIRGRVGEVDLDRRLGPEPFDVVLSDMSPSISGAYATDHARSVTLVRAALTLARNHLKPGGSFVAKAFDGDLLPELDGEAEPLFARWRHTKPPASRSTSSETYLIGLGFRGPASPEPFARPASKDLR